MVAPPITAISIFRLINPIFCQPLKKSFHSKRKASSLILSCQIYWFLVGRNNKFKIDYTGYWTYINF
jgi:hypothetical protein